MSEANAGPVGSNIGVFIVHSTGIFVPIETCQNAKTPSDVIKFVINSNFEGIDVDVIPLLYYCEERDDGSWGFVLDGQNNKKLVMGLRLLPGKHVCFFGKDILAAKRQRFEAPATAATAASTSAVPVQTLTGTLPNFKDLVTVDRPTVFYERDSVTTDVLQYADFIHTRDATSTVFREAKISGGRLHLLGTTGAPGIGKTSLLSHVVNELNLYPDKFRAIYVNFNGGDNSLSADFAEFMLTRKSPSRAFAYALLCRCLPRSTSNPDATLLPTSCDLKMAINVYRRLANVRESAALIFMVDEIGNLGNETATQLAKELMEAADDAFKSANDPPLGFIFSAVYDFLPQNKEATASNRPVQFLRLQPLLIDTWRQVPGAVEYVKNCPQAKHLFLLCAGHPRSLFDNMKVISQKFPSLDLSLAVAARLKLFEGLKLKSPLDATYMAEALCLWLRYTISSNRAEAFLKPMRENLVNHGMLHVNLQGTEFSMLQPLIWASIAGENGGISLFKALYKFYITDAVVGLGSEKHFESVMLHYEVMQRIAWTQPDVNSSMTLFKIFKTCHAAQIWKRRAVTIPRVPEDEEPFVDVQDFNDTSAIIATLMNGQIVVSKKVTEQGVEYLSPFFDANDPTKLIIAGVQCKFTAKAPWDEVKKRYDTAMKPFQELGAETFLVAYTASNVQNMVSDVVDSGFVFTARDLFTHTAHLGVLRMHTAKIVMKFDKDDVLRKMVFGNNEPEPEEESDEKGEDVKEEE